MDTENMGVEVVLADVSKRCANRMSYLGRKVAAVCYFR